MSVWRSTTTRRSPPTSWLLVRGVWRDETLRRLLASPAARFEVPIVFRHEEAGTARLVRGTVDCLVPDGDRMLVLEFKTGRAQPAHRRQLALYVDAVRDMLPGYDGHGTAGLCDAPRAGAPDGRGAAAVRRLGRHLSSIHVCSSGDSPSIWPSTSSK